MIVDIHIQVINQFFYIKKKKRKLLSFLLDEQNSYQLKRSNPTRSEQIDNNDEHHHSQVPRFKQLPIDGMSCPSFFFSIENVKTFFCFLFFVILMIN
jgi:hypothetical protein